MRSREQTEGTTVLGQNAGTAALIGGIGIGAALMYYLDPERGARRRALVRDKVTHAAHVAGETAGTTSRDIANRARGFVAKARTRHETDEGDDRVIEERVRAELGRVCSHPAAIHVMSDQGRVTLTGEILAAESDDVVRRIGHVRGVSDVENRLRVYDIGDGIPSLQGSVPRTGGEFEFSQENWTPAARLLASVAGGAMTVYGASRRDRLGATLGVAGLALLARGATNRDLRRVVGVGGGRKAIHIQKTVNIAAPLDVVFAFMTAWENFPQWMSHVREVRSSGTPGAVGELTHWEVDGPAGTKVSWDAETTRFVPNSLVAWKSVEGSTVQQTGRITFTNTDNGGTRVSVEIQYNPPAGALGHAVATLFGRDPKRQMDDDLARLKTMIETGSPPRDAAASTQQSTTGSVGAMPGFGHGNGPAL